METLPFEKQRELMVTGQLARSGIRDGRVLDAMRRVPRHEFVPLPYTPNSYDDCALPIGHGQTISQPYMVAVMTEHLRLTGAERALEIGTGSGYQTAVLAEICLEVYTIERVAALSERAAATLGRLGYRNVRLRAGDGTLGWMEAAPFDRIIVTAGAPEAPQALLDQLADGGIFLAPVGDRHSQVLEVITKRGNEFDVMRTTPCVFVPLIGEHGWHD